MNKFKENFNFITNILILTLMLLGGLVYADSNGVWNNPSDLVPGGIFGSDETGYATSTYYTFNNPFRSIKYSQFDSNVTIGGVLKVDTIKPNSGNSVEIQLG